MIPPQVCGMRSESQEDESEYKTESSQDTVTSHQPHNIRSVRWAVATRAAQVEKVLYFWEATIFRIQCTQWRDLPLRLQSL